MSFTGNESRLTICSISSIEGGAPPDAYRKEKILAHAAELQRIGLRMISAKLAETLLRTPEEQEVLAKRCFKLGKVENQASAKLEPNGTVVLRLKSVAGTVSTQERKQLLTKLKEVIEKHLGL